MIEPYQSEEQLLTEINRHRPQRGFSTWWLGQSGFLVKSAAGCLLLDPYLSDSLTRKYAETDKPHVRMTRQLVRPAKLDMVDVVTSSHNHTDHLDAETLLPLIRSNPNMNFVIPEANRSFVAERIECDAAWPVGLVDEEAVQVGGYTFHGIAAAHDDVARDDAGRPLFMGYVITFGDYSIFHSGDTLWHDNLLRQIAPFDIDLAMLPINGKLPHRRVAGNLWGQEAAALAHQAGAGLVVPCHFDMFTFNTETPHAFVQKCQELGQPHEVLRCGERLDIDVF